LATCATRGGGPPFSKYGSRVIYRWGDGLAWALSKMTPPRPTSAEHAALRRGDRERQKAADRAALEAPRRGTRRRAVREANPEVMETA